MGEFTKKLLAMASVLLLGGCLEALDLIAAEASGPRTCPTPDGGVRICGSEEPRGDQH